jgi:D12 class N6 adenine-specific DNA methyltransferase.
MKEKVYTTAPLPFQGQKRKFVLQFRTALVELKSKQEVTCIVDLFGGSGLLSRIAKDVFPEAEVIYNDYDNYHRRLRNVERTNQLLADLRSLVIDCPRKVRIKQPYRDKIIERVAQEEKTGYVDYITLSSSLLFSAKYVLSLEALQKESLYNNVRTEGYNFNAKNYLKGLKIVKEDYLALFEVYRDRENVLFLIDPPYLSTDTTTYCSDKYWRLKNYLDVLNTLKTDNYFYFTSSKSQLVELCEWFELNCGLLNPFGGSVLRTNQVNGNVVNYMDMMLYKYRKMDKG